jgi:hypothetical protein
MNSKGNRQRFEAAGGHLIPIAWMKKMALAEVAETVAG